MVFRAVTKNEARKAKKITGASKLVNMMMASGTQAKIGMGRSISNTGKTYSLNFVDQPKKRPSGTPNKVAKAKAMKTRKQLARMCW